MVLIFLAALVQHISAKGQASRLKVLERRMSEILDDASDRPERVEMTHFDEIGELSDRINRIMNCARH